MEMRYAVPLEYECVRTVTIDAYFFFVSFGLQSETKPNSYGASFAANGGGVWATQYDVSGIL